jgi:hypothetical protein
MYVIEWINILSPRRVQSFRTDNQIEMECEVKRLEQDANVHTFSVVQYF